MSIFKTIKCFRYLFTVSDINVTDFFALIIFRGLVINLIGAVKPIASAIYYITVLLICQLFFLLRYHLIELSFQLLDRSTLKHSVDVSLYVGFGLGTGTVAEGWINDAVKFWAASRRSQTVCYIMQTVNLSLAAVSLCCDKSEFIYVFHIHQSFSLVLFQLE